MSKIVTKRHKFWAKVKKLNIQIKYQYFPRVFDVQSELIQIYEYKVKENANSESKQLCDSIWELFGISWRIIKKTVWFLGKNIFSSNQTCDNIDSTEIYSNEIEKVLVNLFISFINKISDKVLEDITMVRSLDALEDKIGKVVKENIWWNVFNIRRKGNKNRCQL